MKLKKIAAFLLVAGMMSGVSSMAAEDKAAPQKCPYCGKNVVVPASADKEGKEHSTWCKIGRAVVFYVPNLLADLADVVSLEFNVGNSFAANAHVTHLLDFGIESTDSYFIGNKPRRRFGAGRREAAMFNLGCFAYEDLYISQTCGNFEDFLLKDKEFDLVECYHDAYRSKKVNFWGIGLRAGFIFGVAVDLNLQEIPDFLTGIFFYDLDNDNWK